MISFRLSNSYAAAHGVFIGRQSEETSLSGIYIGKTARFGLPFFLDFEDLVSPHVAVVGMTGSGKSYLLKSLVARAAVSGAFSVTVLDWNGEYSEVLGAFGREYACSRGKAQQGPSVAPGARAAASFNLSKLAVHAEKVEAARRMLSEVSQGLGRLRQQSRVRHALILDEAWKVASGGELASLFREARKYGVAVIAASQNVCDMPAEILSNAACIVAFRLHAESDFAALRNSELIREQEIARIAGLGVGSCLFVMKAKGSGIQRVAIDRVEGAFESRLLMFTGDGMEFVVKLEKLKRETELLSDDAAARSRIHGFVSGRKEVDLASFIGMLRSLGFGRASVVPYLRRLGIEDACIARAYSESSAIE